MPWPWTRLPQAPQPARAVAQAQRVALLPRAFATWGSRALSAVQLIGPLPHVVLTLLCVEGSGEAGPASGFHGKGAFWPSKI